ncbi:MAG: peptidoglycan-associated lipoprotein, partial [Betaproteobacteria bacterium]|nr:peptidoglycan-associated lipoprotein [Betaproteobacteria bacterium]
MRQSLLITSVLAALLAGCASGVKLNDVPVEDKAATAQSATASGVGAGQDNSSSGVTKVEAQQAG